MPTSSNDVTTTPGKEADARLTTKMLASQSVRRNAPKRSSSLAPRARRLQPGIVPGACKYIQPISARVPVVSAHGGGESLPSIYQQR
eukprot:scaffold2428_cov412-Prasinococcus_capsulatus_cf.AAC.1